MSELPKGWVSSALDDIAVQITKGTTPTTIGFSYEATGIPFIKIENITNKKINKESISQFISETAHTALLRSQLYENDILFSIAGTIGKTALVTKTDLPANTNQAIAIIRASENLINHSFLQHQLSSLSKDFLAEMSRGGAMNNVSLGDIKSFEVKIPPLAEQTRIAQKLNELLAQVDTLKTRIDAIPALLKRFRQSVLAAAVSGRLTEEWRVARMQSGEIDTQDYAPFHSDCDDPAKKSNQINQTALVLAAREQGGIPEGWHWKMLVNLAKLESGHTPRKSIPAYWENGDVPWLSLQDIRAADGTEIHQTKYMPTMLGIENSSARLLPKGTVCFCRDISVGYVTIMGKPMSTTQHFANWICKEELTSKYLMYAFMASREHLTRSGQGSTVKTIYMPALKELRLSTPPIEEQTEIVRRVEQLFAFADLLEAKVASAKSRIDHLSQSILAKAFRGELVPQDPNDEPASELLQRIQAQRAAAPKAKRGRKPMPKI